MELEEKEKNLIEAQTVEISKNMLYASVFTFPAFLLIGALILYTMKWETFMIIILSLVSLLMLANVINTVLAYLRLKIYKTTPQLIVTDQRIFIYNRKINCYDTVGYNDITFWNFKIKNAVKNKRALASTSPILAEFIFIANGIIYKARDVINYQDIYNVLHDIIPDTCKK